jgi:hypothetical protein
MAFDRVTKPKLLPISPAAMLLAPVLVTAPVAEDNVTDPVGPIPPSRPPMMLLPAAVTGPVAVEDVIWPSLVPPNPPPTVPDPPVTGLS